MIQLDVTDFHWLGDSDKEKQYDLCLHAHVFLKLDDDILSDEECCVSAAALRFMRSVFTNHFMGAEQHMLPCCGHFMVPSEDKQTVDIYGCSNGVDFDVLHEDTDIVIRTADLKLYRYPFYEYRNAVLSFAGEVEQYYCDSPERITENSFEADCLTAFKAEWNALKQRVAAAI